MYLTNVQVQLLRDLIQKTVETRVLYNINNFNQATKAEYYRQLDVTQLRISELQWFRQSFRTNIYNIVLPNGTPEKFQPSRTSYNVRRTSYNVQIRDAIFFNGLQYSSQRIFISELLFSLHRTMHATWRDRQTTTTTQPPLKF